MSTAEVEDDLKVKVYDTFKTIAPADSVEFCPHEALHDYFVCGNYMLSDREAQTKSGGVYLFQTQPSENGFKMNQAHHVTTEAVFDLKW